MGDTGIIIVHRTFQVDTQLVVSTTGSFYCPKNVTSAYPVHFTLLPPHLLFLLPLFVFCFVLFCFVLFCFVLFCFVLFCFDRMIRRTRRF